MKNPGGYLFRLADRLGQRRTTTAARELVTDPHDLEAAPWFDSETKDEMVTLLRLGFAATKNDHSAQPQICQSHLGHSC